MDEHMGALQRMSAGRQLGHSVRCRGRVENQQLLTGSEICLRRRSGHWCGQLASDEVDLEWSGGGE